MNSAFLTVRETRSSWLDASFDFWGLGMSGSEGRFAVNVCDLGRSDRLTPRQEDIVLGAENVRVIGCRMRRPACRIR